MPRAGRFLRGQRIATPAGIRPAGILILDGRIGAVLPFETAPGDAELIEAGDALVFPGLVDSHVHINEPGRTDWEGFATATRAAAAGGVTTLVDMPLNSTPPTTSVAALEAKRRAAHGRCAVDVGFLGGVVPGNEKALPALHEEGVLGFKCFLCPSGVDDFSHVVAADLREALPVLAVHDALLMAHAELPPYLTAPSGDPRQYAGWLAARPVAAEVRAVELLIDLVRHNEARVHVVHVSSPEAAELIMVARARGIRISGETCPHYLTFSAEDIPDGATEYKCAPPIRDAARRDGLWAALRNGSLELVVSDHSPAPPSLKQRQSGNFFAAWGGIAALQLRLPAVWTLARSQGVSPLRLVDWLCTAPARLVGLEHRKGSIAPGLDADLVLWHPEHELLVEPAMLRQRHPLNPWLGRRLAGVVEATYLRGELVYRQGEPDRPASGRLLSRNHP